MLETKSSGRRLFARCGVPLMLAGSLTACELVDVSPVEKTEQEAAAEVNAWMNEEIHRLDEPLQPEDMDEELLERMAAAGELPQQKSGGGGGITVNNPPTLAHECTGGKPCVGIRRTLPEVAADHTATDLAFWSWALTGDEQPTNQWCFLSGLGGGLNESFDAVYLDRGTGCIEMGDREAGGAGTTKWRLSIEKENAEDSLSGEATCIPTSNFKRDAGAVIWPSEEFYASRSDSGEASAWAWKNDAATMISMVRGNFAGSEERVRIRMEGDSDDRAKVLVHSGADNRHSGAARSLFVGTPRGPNPMWIIPPPEDFRLPWQEGPYPTVNIPPIHGELSGSADDNSRTYRLPRTNLGFCYLTRVSGDFRGAGEQIRIFPKKVENYDGGREHWYLYVKAGRGSVQASVRCMAYDQTTPPQEIPL
jgi:hypothetical protein